MKRRSTCPCPLIRRSNPSILSRLARPSFAHPTERVTHLLIATPPLVTSAAFGSPLNSVLVARLPCLAQRVADRLAMHLKREQVNARHRRPNPDETAADGRNQACCWCCPTSRSVGSSPRTLCSIALVIACCCCRIAPSAELMFSVTVASSSSTRRDGSCAGAAARCARQSIT